MRAFVVATLTVLVVGSIPSPVYADPDPGFGPRSYDLSKEEALAIGVASAVVVAVGAVVGAVVSAGVCAPSRRRAGIVTAAVLAIAQWVYRTYRVLVYDARGGPLLRDDLEGGVAIALAVGVWAALLTGLGFALGVATGRRIRKGLAAVQST